MVIIFLKTGRDCNGGYGSVTYGLSCTDAESVCGIISEDGAKASGGHESEFTDFGHEFGKRTLYV